MCKGVQKRSKTCISNFFDPIQKRASLRSMQLEAMQLEAMQLEAMQLEAMQLKALLYYKDHKTASDSLST
jgi:hypothetical protein